MRIGILGVAHLHIDMYLEYLRAVEDVEVVGVADGDLSRAQRWAATRDIDVFLSFEALLERNLEAVLVCCETSEHLNAVTIAAEAGVAILCEKPLATTLEDARSIVDACRRGNVPLMTAFPMRFSAPIIQARGLVLDGALGQPHAFTGVNQGQLPTRQRAWFADPVLAGGGAIMDHAVHLTDVFRWYLEREVSEVYAVANRILYGESVTVETGAVLMLTFDGGAIATIDCSWSRPDSYPKWGGLSFELVGDKGTMSVDAFSQDIFAYRDDVQRIPYGEDPSQAMVVEFCSSVREQRPPAVTGEDGLRATEVALAAYESVHTGQPVMLKPFLTRRGAAAMKEGAA